jgi:Chromo (CHRromatin Organisation MOdifier) domain
VISFRANTSSLSPMMKIHRVFHVSLLKPTENETTKEDVEATEFEVERIIDKRIKQGKEQFRIRWSGYEEKGDTWEPVKNLNCPDKIQEFEESLESSDEHRQK